MLSLKKSLIFGCALLLTALVFFSGCPSPSSSDIFIQVTDITGVPATGTEGVEVDLSGAKVVPAEAHYKTISWSVREAGTTIELSGEGIVNAKFTPAGPGTLVLTATIANGRAEGMDYTKAFTITIAPKVPDPEPLDDLKGLWVSNYGEEFIIDNTEFTSVYQGATSYKGEVVNVRMDTDGNSEKGYITIRYTENTYNPGWVGNYYVIRWEDWTAGSTITISGASPGDGYSTIVEAETNYSGSIGVAPFTSGSDCHFIAVAGQSSAIIGTWNDDEGEGFTYYISDKLVVFSMSYTTYFVGEIVNVRTLPGNANYITFKFVTNEAPYTSLVGKYCVLYWTNLSTGAQTTADMAAVYMSSRPGDDGKATQAEAESSYVEVDPDIDSDGPYAFIRQ